jgi:DUF4097 and DUF4098 domain-containing protein YvlB
MALVAIVSSGLGPAFASDDGCKFRAERKAGIDAAGVTKIVLRTGAGDLNVNGRTNATGIEAHGTACAATQALVDQVQLTVRREGNVVYLETQMPQEQGLSWGKNSYANIDLNVALPDLIAVDAVDSSGDATFEDLKSLTLQDSSGDLDLTRIAGSVDVGDSSGDLEIHGAGSVRVRDSSGDVGIGDVKGDVDVLADSSGDIEIRQVEGSVQIEQDSSGGIRVEDVRGNVTVDSDSSGDIHAGRVRGDFTVKEDSSGSIGHEAIGGKISVPRNHADD